MNNWKKCKLGDIAEILNGYAFKSKDFLTGKTINSLPVVKIKNVANNSYALEEMQFCLYKEELSRYVINNKDILIALTGNHPEANTQVVGMVSRYKSEIKGLLNQRVAKITANDKADNVFLYYFLSFEETHNYIASFSSGSANQANISKTDLETIEILLPPLEEQRQIATILSSIDDKIELLHEQNKTLEELAQTLFRHYFIENPNPSWQEKPLSDFGNIICGKTPSKKVDKYYNGDIPFIKIPDMHGNIFVFKTNECLSELGSQTQINKLIPKKSICVSCIATVGVVSMNAFESHTNQQINSIVPKNEHYRYFLYLYMKHLYDYLQSMASGGTATANLNTRDFSNIHILMPDEEMMINFSGKTSEYFDKIFKNLEQIQTLENMRDILIPKLLNGEIKINN
ncbi:restriction endonuclease subunit S [Campylobacter lari]|nr:restriction endonuclease subunit S [Campylobacter lari]